MTNIPSEEEAPTHFIKSSFVFTDWDIKYRTQILQQITKSSEKEKRQKNLEMALVNLFQLRRSHDPAFQCYVYKEIIADSQFWSGMKRKISLIIGEVLESPDQIQKQMDTGLSIFQIFLLLLHYKNG